VRRYDPVIDELLEVTDLVMLDLKQMNDEIHQNLVGVSNHRTMEFARYISGKGIKTWIRYVVVPGWSDDDDSAHRLGEFTTLSLWPAHATWDGFINGWKTGTEYNFGHYMLNTFKYVIPKRMGALWEARTFINHALHCVLFRNEKLTQDRGRHPAAYPGFREPSHGKCGNEKQDIQ
jgi:hypothetical protein